jgi:hypothetical protein
LDGILIKSGYYLNNTDISILVNTSVKGTFIYSLIVNDTSNNVSGYSVTVTVSEENKIDWFLLVSLIIGAVAIGVFSMFVYSKTKKRMVNKQEKIFQEKMADYRYFVDLNHIHQIILIYKSSGLVLSSHVLREGHNLDDDLTGGFLTAISNFGEEMKGGSLKTLEFEGFKTLIISTGNIRVAIFFSEEPADILKDKLVEFVNHYESVNHEDIINYNGNRLPFKGFGTVFEDFFNMEILQKHELVIPLKISNLPSLQKRIIGVCSVHGKPQRMEVFMTLCIEKIKRPAFELYQEILVLKKMGIFVLKCE